MVPVIKHKKELKPSLIEKRKKRVQAEQRNRQYQLIKEIDQDLQPIEEKIHHLDKKKADIEEKLCRKEILHNSTKVQSLKVDLHQTNHKLDQLITRWEMLINKKEKIGHIFPKG